jgi:hypothetical protein
MIVGDRAYKNFNTLNISESAYMWRTIASADVDVVDNYRHANTSSWGGLHVF